jgi:hypothetical protein
MLVNVNGCSLPSTVSYRLTANDPTTQAAGSSPWAGFGRHFAPGQPISPLARPRSLYGLRLGQRSQGACVKETDLREAGHSTKRDNALGFLGSC